MPTPAMLVTYTKVAFQATHISVVTQTTEDTHTLPATATPMTATTPMILATATPTTATTLMTIATQATPSIITIITIITITTPTKVKMSVYNSGIIEASSPSPFEGDDANNTVSYSNISL